MLCISQVIRVASNNKHNVPYNIASYATLALILEKITGYKALAIQGDLKKVHLYNNSLDAVKEQLDRDINKFDKCKLELHPEFEICTNAFNRGVLTLDDFINELRTDMFQLKDYESYPAINVEMLSRSSE